MGAKRSFDPFQEAPLEYAPMRRFSSTVMVGKTRRPWGTRATPRRTTSSALGGNGSPPSRISPSRGSRPAMALRVEVLPAPLGPMRATISPSPMVRSIP
jgi:hypothetical protein